MAQYALVYVNHAHLQNRSAPSCYFTTAVLNDCYSELTAYTVLAYSYWASFHDDAYITPTNDTDYSCHIKPCITLRGRIKGKSRDTNIMYP